MRRTPATGLASLLVVLVVSALASPARAEIVELLDKTKLNAKIIHYFDGVYTLETGGNTIKLPREKIKSIAER